MALFQLNDDILAIIMSYTNRGAVSRFARTCHAAYQLALPRLLSEVDLYFKNDHPERSSTGGDNATRDYNLPETSLTNGTLTQDGRNIETTPDYPIARFCRFILADVQGRASHVRALTIHDYCDPSEGSDTKGLITCVHLLCEVLRHTVRITDVTLDDMDTLLTEHGKLATAVARLPNIQSFKMVLTRIDTIPWPQVAFQPRKLVIRVGWEWYECADVELEIKAFYQMLALPNFSKRLEYLDVDHCEDLLETATANNAIALPTVRTLKIRDVCPSTMAVAARMFPDVRALKITHCLMDDYSIVYTLASWSRLDTVTVRHGGLMANVPTALGSHVRCLCLEADQASTFCMTSTLPLLERTSPVVLTIRTIHPLCDAQSVSELQRCVKAAPELRFMQLEFYQITLHDAQWSRWIEITQVSSLRQSLLKGMLFSFITSGAISSRDECPMLAKGFSAQILTLQYVGFQSVNKYPPGEVNQDWSIWYHVKRNKDGGEPILEEFLPEQGYLIHRELLATPRC